MNNSYLWAADDAKSGRCSIGVIGTERQFDPPDQLGDMWSTDDAIAGRCLASEVGQSRRAPQHTVIDPPQSDDADVFAEPPDDDDVPWTLDVVASELKAYIADKPGYRAKSPANLNKLMDYSQQYIKAQSAVAVDIDRLTIKRMRSMSADDLSAALLAFVATIPGDDYKAILRRFLGLDDATLQAQLDDAL